MALNKTLLKGKIIPLDIRNINGQYKESDVRGISTQKEFIETKADLTGVNLNSYKIVPPKCFAYVPDTSRRGDKMALAYNDTNQAYLISSIYTVFQVNENSGLDADYLGIFFNHPCTPAFQNAEFMQYRLHGYCIIHRQILERSHYAEF